MNIPAWGKKYSDKIFVLVLLAWLSLVPASGWAALGYLSATDGQSVLEYAGSLKTQGVTVLQLTPEGRLVVDVPDDLLNQKERSVALSSWEAMPPVETDKAIPTAEYGLGDRPATPEEQAWIDENVTTVKTIAANDLSKQRAALEGKKASLDALPSTVDNSTSQYFPPIRSQGSQGSCTTWASGYYYATYTQARDHGLDASSGNNDYICSPAYMYALVNGGSDSGANTASVVYRLNDIGICSWSTMPYNSSDYLTWPSEQAWVEALDARMDGGHTIGTTWNGCTDAELEAIKQHLANGNVMVTRTSVYTNWYNSYSSTGDGIDNWVVYEFSGDYAGGHAMTIVGYDDTRVYNDGTGDKTGALLIANSWGSWWGATNTVGTRGFMWVAYDLFKGANDAFGVGYYNDDREDYRPQLYAVSGINHVERGNIRHFAGVGTTGSPAWTSYYPVSYAGGQAEAVDDSRRIAIDLTDGIPQISDVTNINLFTAMYVSSAASEDGTISSADFYVDFDNDGSYQTFSSTDPVVTVVKGTTDYAALQFSIEDLLVSPLGTTSVTGETGGPFSPETVTYTLTNDGDDSLDWTATCAENWVTLSSTSGQLTAGNSTSVVASFNAQTQALAGGNHSADIIFENLATGFEQTATLDLTLSAVATLPFSEDFEDGMPLETYWETDGTGTWRIEATDANSPPYEGTYHLIMDDSVSDSTNARNELTLSIDMAGYENVVLSFQARGFGEESNPCPAIPYSGHADYDGVAISEDGDTWYEVQSLTSMAESYTEYVVDLDAAIATHGLSYNKNFQIRFNQYDNYAAPTDGIGIDAITITGDLGVPLVAAINCACATPTNSDQICYNVDFTEAVTGVDASDFSAWVDGDLSGATIDHIDGSGSSYAVYVDYNGELGNMRLDVVDDDSIVNGSSRPLGGTGTGNGDFSSGTICSIDRQVPSVSAITRLDPDPTNASSVQFRVTFNESVTGVDVTDFVLSNVGVTADIDAISGSGDQYDITLTNILGNGSLQLALVDDDSIVDDAGNLLGDTGAGNGDYNAGEAYTIDLLAPQPTLSTLDANPTLSPAITVAISFNEPVTGLQLDDFALSNATLSDLTGSGDSYSCTATAQSEGTFTVTLSAGAAQDLAGNVSLASGTLEHQMNAAVPTVSSMVRTGGSLTNAATVDFEVAFSESVSGVDTSDFSVRTEGDLSAASVHSVTPQSATVWTVEVATGSGDGTLYLDLLDDDTIVDGMGAPLGGAGVGNGASSGTDSYTLDRTAPTVVLSLVGTPEDGAQRVTLQATFSESVTGFGSGDINLVNATIENFSGSGSDYQFDLVGTSDGNFSASIGDAAGTDPAGNASVASESIEWFYNETAPVVLSITRLDDNPTALTSVTLGVQFSEAVTGVDLEDFDVTLAGEVTAVSLLSVTGSGSDYVIAVSTGTGDGYFRVDLIDDDSIVDLYGMPLGDSGVGNGDYTAGQSYMVDQTAPTSLVVADSWAFTEDEPVIELNYSAEDGFTGCQCVRLYYRRYNYGDEGPFQQYPGEFTSSPIAFDTSLIGASTGTYECYTVAVDEAGNEEGEPVIVKLEFLLRKSAVSSQEWALYR